MDLNFKTWIEASASLSARSDAFFNTRDQNSQLDVGKAMGFKVPLVQINRGSLANIYQHPTDPNKIVKVTSDKRDVDNLFKAQRLNSRNIVKLYGKPKQIKSGTFGIIADKIPGRPMVYDTNSFISLIYGKQYQSLDVASDAMYDPDPYRQKILEKFGKNNNEEHNKLQELFQTLWLLSSQLRIDMSDFADNIMDAGSHYVIIDLAQ